VRTVYLGTSEFAAVVLRRLADSPHRPELVVTRPDAPRGRGRRLAPPPVAVVARELGLEVIQPERLHDADVLERIAAARPDVLTTCAYGVLIKEPLLSDYEMLNVHPSLLPRWRGAAPIERAMMAGDAETGVSIMRVTAGWDAGPVYLAAAEPIRPDDDYGTLSARLETLGAELLVRALDEHPEPVEQDAAGVTYAHKITATDRALDPTQRPEEVERTVRALRPHIGARLPLPDGSFLGVLAARVDGPTLAPAGGLVRAEGERLLLDCHGGALELTEIRPPGARAMAAAEWLRGRPDPRLTHFRLDPALPERPLEELIARARAEWADHGDDWKPHVCALAARESRETLSALVALGSDADPAARELAAVLLGQLDGVRRALAPDQEAALRAMAARERDPGVLGAIACAFGHLGERAGHDWLLDHAGDADADVREGVAFALAGRGGDAAREALIRLSGDPEPRVRDWATFALGTLADDDSPELREALAARLADPDADTRLEAIHGLAVRQDPRAAEPARELLARDDRESVWNRYLLGEAARALDLRE
jgi:methionyl-tRNA formyltransferase